jgi:hypothetical protein
VRKKRNAEKIPFFSRVRKKPTLIESKELCVTKDGREIETECVRGRESRESAGEKRDRLIIVLLLHTKNHSFGKLFLRLDLVLVVINGYKRESAYA